MNAAAYARVSTEELAKGMSIGFQIEKCTEYAKNEGYENVKNYIDAGISGTKFLERKGLMDLINDIEDGKIDALFVKESDRLSRKLIFQLRIQELCEKYDVKFYTLNNGLMNFKDETEVFKSQLEGALAQMEVSKTTRKVIAAKEHKFKRGEFNGGPPPYGYVKEPNNNIIQIHPEKSETIKTIFNLYLGINHHRPLGSSGIAQYLKDKNIPSTRGNSRWTHATILRILTNPVYKGYVRKVSKNRVDSIEIINGLHESIITHEQWDKVNKRIHNSKIKGKRDVGKFEAIYRRLLKCECGGTYSPIKRKLKSKTPGGDPFKRLSYNCPHVRDGENCKAPQIQQPKMERAFIHYFTILLHDLHKLYFSNQINLETAFVKTQIKKENEKLANLNSKSENINMMLMEDEIDDDTYKNLIKVQSQMINKQKNIINDLEKKLTSLVSDEEIDYYKNFIERGNKIITKWNSINNQEKIEYLNDNIQYINISFKNITIKGYKYEYLLDIQVLKYTNTLTTYTGRSVKEYISFKDNKTTSRMTV